MVLAVLVTMYAALLRCDAYAAKYGPLPSPTWARVLTTQGAALGRALRPYEPGWPPVPNPYVGGDPFNYLRFAREMTSFYQAHVREPLFLAMTRVYLWLLNGRDAAVSFASATGSVLAVLGTFLLASMLLPRAVALVPALGMAVDHEVIDWAVDGWRDDLFTATAMWAAWAFLRVRAAPSRGNAAVLGICAATACLTRLTALSFVIPALAWLVVDAPHSERRRRVEAAALALGVMTLLVAPYVINCAIATGDPFYSINYHTVYYRHREGQSIETEVSAAGYLGAHFARRPIRMFDIGVTGFLVQPLASKWNGLHPVLHGARPLVLWAAVAGLVLMLWTPAGRLLLIVLFTSLVPYAFIWHIGDGSAFRFTMHVYPIYMIAASYSISLAISGGTSIVRTRQLPHSPRRLIAMALITAVLAVSARWAYDAIRWLVVRETIAAAEDVSVAADTRDTIFWTRGWSEPRGTGVVTRVSRGERSTILLPLPAKRDYDLVLRVDPVAPGTGQRLNVVFNGQFVRRFGLDYDPQRVGAYQLRIPAAHVRAWRNHLTLLPEPTIAAASAGPAYAWMAPNEQIGIRVWYVRVLGAADSPQ